MLMVGISYKKGVVICEQYKGPITGKKNAKNIVANSVPAASDRVGGRLRQIDSTSVDGVSRLKCEKEDGFCNMDAQDRIVKLHEKYL